MEKEKQLLLLCKQLIEKKLNWGDSSIWTNDDFDQLSESIFAQTKVQLSVSTLKRIWGKVRYENFPTSATLNALAGFIGYDSWRDFRQKNEAVEPVNLSQKEIGHPAAPVVEPRGDAIKKSPSKIAWFALAAAGVLLISGLTYFKERHKEIAVDPSLIKFSAVKVSDTLPNSVIFNYDVSAFKSDSVYIQQSWDPRRRELVTRDGKQHTSVYYNPGYFIAKLLVNNRRRKECIVSIKTNGWKGIIEKSPVPIYLSGREIKSKGSMGITGDLLHEKTGSPVFNNLWVHFANVREFAGIDAGNFTFEATLRNTSAVEASVRRMAQAVILGKGTAIIIPMGDKGCISELSLLTGDTYINGKDHDMSAFGVDFSKFHHLQCTIQNKQLKIYLDDKLIFTIAQKYTIEAIEGLRFEFEGAGEVKDIKLYSPGGGKYEEGF